MTHSATSPESAGHDDGRSDEDLAAIGVEPDNPPTTFLAWLGVGITVAVVLIVAGTYGLFRYTVAAELRAKGYSVNYEAPAEEQPK